MLSFLECNLTLSPSELHLRHPHVFSSTISSPLDALQRLGLKPRHTVPTNILRLSFPHFSQHLPAWRRLAWFSPYSKNPAEPARSARFLLYMNISPGSFSTWPHNANTQLLRLRTSSYFIHFYAEDHEPYSESFLLQPFQTSSPSPQPLLPTCKPQANFGPTNSSCLSIIYTRYDKGQQEHFLQLMWNKSCMTKTSELQNLYPKVIFWFRTIYTQNPT